jgi:hypothetical protein
LLSAKKTAPVTAEVSLGWRVDYENEWLNKAKPEPLPAKPITNTLPNTKLPMPPSLP